MKICSIIFYRDVIKFIMENSAIKYIKPTIARYRISSNPIGHIAERWPYMRRVGQWASRLGCDQRA